MKIFHNHTMRCQILTTTIFITIIIFGVSAGLMTYVDQIAYQQLQEASNQIYYQTSSRTMMSQLQSYKMLISKILEINGSQLVTLHRLYSETLQLIKSYDNIQLDDRMNMNYSGTNQIPDKLRIPNGYGTFDTSYSFLCYSNLTPLAQPLTREQLIGIKLQQYVQAFGQIIYQEQLTKQSFDYVFTLPDRIFSIYPCLCRGDSVFKYIPEKRDFYIEALRMYNPLKYTEYQYKLTKPYLLYTQQIIGLSLVMPMIDNHKKFIGAIGTNIYGSEFSQFIKNTNDEEISMLLLVDMTGAIIVHNYTITVDQLPAYFYNESITGFNNDDWQQIISVDGISNCLGATVNITRKCRYNSLYKQSLIIEIIKLEQYELFLIMFRSSLKYFTFQNNFNQKIEQYFQDYLTQYLYIMVGLLCLFIVLISVVIVIIIRPLNSIIRNSEVKVGIKGQIFAQNVIQNEQFCTSSSLQSLQSAFFNVFRRLNGHLSGRQLTCVQIENRQYPTRIYRINQLLLPLMDKLKYRPRVREVNEFLNQPILTILNQIKCMSTQNVNTHHALRTYQCEMNENN